jgi:hypothetical protein
MNYTPNRPPGGPMSRPFYRITIIIDTPTGEMLASGIEVHSYTASEAQWDPINEADSLETAWITGTTSPEKAKQFRNKRKQLASIITEQLADHIVAQLATRDLINGYKKDPAP